MFIRAQQSSGKDLTRECCEATGGLAIPRPAGKHTFGDRYLGGSHIAIVPTGDETTGARRERKLGGSRSFTNSQSRQSFLNGDVGREMENLLMSTDQALTKFSANTDTDLLPLPGAAPEELGTYVCGDRVVRGEFISANDKHQ